MNNPVSSILFNGKFLLKLPAATPRLVLSLHRIDGIQWDSMIKGWWVPAESIFDIAATIESEASAAAHRLRTHARFEEVRARASNYRTVIAASCATDSLISIPAPTGLTYLGYQKAGIQFAKDKKQCLIADEMGLGKAQPLSAKVLTPSGWSTMGDMKVGTPIVGADGGTYHVTGVYPQGVKTVYDVVFEGGGGTECCEDHLWKLINQNTQESIVIPLKEIFNHHHDEWQIPGFAPCNIPPRCCVEVNTVGDKECQCISVSAPDRLYVTDDFIVTHNTIQALGLINIVAEDIQKPPQTLIIVPVIVKTNWYREAAKWLVKKCPVLVVDGKTNPAIIPSHKVVIINYDILHKFQDALTDIDWDILIGDEAHKIKNEKAQRSTSFREISYFAERRILMTGTPIMNRPSELWHLLHIIDPTMWDNFFEFARRYCNAKMGHFGWDTSGVSNAQELQRILRETCMVRRLKKDVLKELPPKRRQVVEISGTGFEKILKAEQAILQKHKKEYEKALAAIDTAHNAIVYTDAGLENEEEYKDAVKGLQGGAVASLAEIAKIRKETAMAKLPKVIDFIKDVLETKSKVVVMAHHRDVVDGIVKAFGKHAVKVQGGQSPAERQVSVDRFRKDPNVQVFVGSIQAAGVGITLVESDTVIFAELVWTPAELTQAEDRCFAAGQRVLTPAGGKNIELIKKGDYVIGGVSGKPCKVLDAWATTGTFPMTRIKLWGSQQDLICTSNHRLRMATGEWVEAGKLREKERLAFVPVAADTDPVSSIPFPASCRLVKETFLNGFGKPQRNGRYIKIPDILDLTPDFLFMCGYYVGDGYIVQGRAVGFAGNQTTKMASLLRIMDTVNSFGFCKSRKIGGGIRDNGAGFCMYSKDMAAWFLMNFGTGSKGKRFASFIYDLSFSQLQSFLDGLMASDGYQKRNCYCTGNAELADSVAWLLARLGYRPTVYYADQAQCYSVGYVPAMEGNYRVRSGDVRSITTEEQETTVYDITVENDESFVVERAVAHNCHRIGQEDVVTIFHLVVEGSIDAYMAKKLVAKQEVIDRVINIEHI